MSVELFLERFRDDAYAPAFIFGDETITYADFLRLIEAARTPFDSIVALEAEPSPAAYAHLFALLKNCNIVVPLLSSLPAREREIKREIAKVENEKSSHPLYENLARGIVLFSSGSTGEPKAIVHDFDRLTKRFVTPRSARRMLQSLLFDHIGGLNTVLSSLSTGGCLVLPEKPDPATTIETLKKHNIEVLPTSPSFLHWILLSRELEKTELPDLQLITYGTEPMPATLLSSLKQKLPHVSFKQTYGLSETGILSTQSRGDDSVWIRVRDDVRIKNGLLEIKTEASMLGYLNAESPFTADGWFQTFDAVEVDGEWLKILGRKSNLINVGGIKVSPIEIENVLLEMPEVAEATIFGEKNPLLGEIVKAKIRLFSPIPVSEFRTRMRLHCRERLEPCKIPQDVQILETSLAPPTGKKVRSPGFSPF